MSTHIDSIYYDDLIQLPEDDTTYDELPIVNANKNEGYPSFKSLPDVSILLVQVSPFPTMLHEVDANKNEGYPSIPLLPSVSVLPIQVSPFPRIMPQVKLIDFIQSGNIVYKNEGYPAFEYLPSATNLYIQKAPFPKIMASLDEEYNEGYLTFRQHCGFGAGYFAEELEEIEIPYSVTYIADYAFWGTKLKHVKINRHCVYFPHTFPNGCHIKPYKDDE